MTTIGTTATTNHAMYDAAVSTASPDRNDADTGIATADSARAATSRNAAPQALLNLNRTIALPVIPPPASATPLVRGYCAATSFQPAPGSNAVIFAPISAESFPRSFSKILPLWLTMKVITPLSPNRAGYATI